MACWTGSGTTGKIPLANGRKCRGQSSRVAREFAYCNNARMDVRALILLPMTLDTWWLVSTCVIDELNPGALDFRLQAEAQRVIAAEYAPTGRASCKETVRRAARALHCCRWSRLVPPLTRAAVGDTQCPRALQSCKQNLEKGKLRMSMKVPVEALWVRLPRAPVPVLRVHRPGRSRLSLQVLRASLTCAPRHVCSGSGMVTSYFHPECFFTKTMPRARAWKVTSIDEVQLPAELTAGASHCTACGRVEVEASADHASSWPEPLTSHLTRACLIVCCRWQGYPGWADRHWTDCRRTQARWRRQAQARRRGGRRGGGGRGGWRCGGRGRRGGGGCSQEARRQAAAQEQEEGGRGGRGRGGGRFRGGGEAQDEARPA